MKSKISIALLCIVAGMYGCKKDLTHDTPKAQKEGTHARTLGAIPSESSAYRKLIQADRLRNAKTEAICTSVDLTNLFPTPGDQGWQGSCVSWAVAYSAKSYWESREIGWSLNTSNHLFSPQYVYSQTHADNSAGGGGSYFADALNLVTNQGVSTLDVTPYDPYNEYGFQTQPTAAMRTKAYPFKNAGWSAVPYRNVEEIRVHLCNNEPVILGFPVYPDFDNLGVGNEIYDNLSGTLRGYHAVTIIGYDDARQAFKIVNQWGTFWGLSGYGWISYNLIANNNWESYVMYDRQNALFMDTWGATTTTGIGLGYVGGDFNGDGYTDIIHPWDNGGNLALIVHNISGAGTNIMYSTANTGMGSGNVGFVPGDFNGDGKGDLVQGWSNGGKLGLIAHISNGVAFNVGWANTTGQGSGNIQLLPVDMDGDGKTDVAQIWNNGGSLGVFVYRSTGSSFTQAATYLPAGIGSGNVGFVSADYDGDGKTDIIQTWNNNNNLGIIVHRSTGSGYQVAWAGTMPQGYNNVGLVALDYDGDGKTDLVQAWKDNNTNLLNLLVYRSTGSSYVYAGNTVTRQGPLNYGFIPVKRVGERDAFVQVWKNGSNTAFFRYDVMNYQ
jgi:C1A family cysteine protease